jgi:hypothetical protein
VSGPLLGVSTITGFGYGVNDDGDRVGGFGMGMFSPAGTAQGGVGGVLLGREFRLGPIILALNILGGVGGVNEGSSGYMVVFGQADLEVGIAWLPWMQIAIYVGYQSWGSLFPGIPFASATSSAPVLGLRIAWGQAQR